MPQARRKNYKSNGPPGKILARRVQGNRLRRFFRQGYLPRKTADAQVIAPISHGATSKNDSEEQSIQNGNIASPVFHQKPSRMPRF